jgi:hypothetical protein
MICALIHQFQIEVTKINPLIMCHSHIPQLLSQKIKVFHLTKLTFLDIQEHADGTSGRRSWVANGLANVLATVLHLDVGNFEASVEIACVGRQRSVALSNPVDACTHGSLVTTLKNDFATYIEHGKCISFRRHW